MINSQESESDESIGFAKNLIAYIRARDLNDFHLTMKQKLCRCCALKDLNNNNGDECVDNYDGQLIDECVDDMDSYLESDESDEEANDDAHDDDHNYDDFVNDNRNRATNSAHYIRLKAPASSGALWNRLDTALGDLKDSNFADYVRSCTQVVRMHVKHRIRLDTKCYKILFYCKEPRLMRDLFDLDIVHPRESSHINCFYERNFIFSAVDPLSVDEHSFSNNVLLSLAILLYRTRVHKSKLVLLACLNRDLVSFIFSELYSDLAKRVGFRFLLRSFILNGLLNRPALGTLLAARDDDSSFDSDNMDFSGDDEDDDELDDSIESGESDDDREMRLMRRLINNHHHHHHHHRHNHRDHHEDHRSVAEYLDIAQANANEYTRMFPLTLKNLCRISIKNALRSFNSGTVRRLTILPAVLQDFILFNDEIDNLLRFASKE